MEKFNLFRAIRFSATGALIGWTVGCLAALLLQSAGFIVFGNWFRMASYHVRYFYWYLAIMAVFYGIFLLIFLHRHPADRRHYYIVCLLGMMLIVSVSAFPCTMLYVLHDMQAGFFPAHPGIAFTRALPEALFSGWLVVLLSFPFNVLALAGFLYVTRKLTTRFDATDAA